MKRLAILISMLFCVLYAGAQSNIIAQIEKSVRGEGKVYINQPSKLASLMGVTPKPSGKTKKSVEGYRVLVYSGNNSSQARQEANKMAENALVPESIWAKEKQALLSARNIGTIKKFAEKYQVALPIVIGKIHWETQRYNTFTNYLGNIHDYLPGNIG